MSPQVKFQVSPHVCESVKSNFDSVCERESLARSTCEFNGLINNKINNCDKAYYAKSGSL